MAHHSIDWEEHLSAKGRLCIFVGSGVSAGCTNVRGESPPTWDQFIDSLAECYYEGELPKELELLERAELVERARKSKGVSDLEFARKVATFVDVSSGSYFSPSIVHNTLADLEPGLIITTNYDRIIERSLNSDPNGEVAFNVWTYPDRVEQIISSSSCRVDDGLGDLFREGSPLIVKLHGGIPDIGPEAAGEVDVEGVSDDSYQLVFSYKSYRKAYGPESNVPSFLRAVFASFQVVFIGYSLRDAVLRDILDSVGSLKGSRFRHVILQQKGSVVPEEYREAFQESYGVVVGDYADHQLLASSLHPIKNARFSG